MAGFQRPQPQQSTSNSRPAATPAGEKTRFDVFTVRDNPQEGGKAFWTRIGVAFSNRDGSLSVILDALPVDGKLQIREYVPKPQEGG